MKLRRLEALVFWAGVLFPLLSYADDGVWERVGQPKKLTTFYDISVCNIGGTRNVFAAESSGTSAIWRSADDGTNWIMPPGNPVANHYYKQIVMQPNDGLYGWAILHGNSDDDELGGAYQKAPFLLDWTIRPFPAGVSRRVECLAADVTDPFLRMAYVGTHTAPESAAKLLRWNGVTWSQWDSGIAGAGSVIDIAVFEGNPLNMYCVFVPNESEPGQLWYSDNGGQSWNQIIPIVGLKKVVAHPTDYNYLFAVMEDPPNEIWASTNGGTTWTTPFQNYGIWGACHSIEFARLPAPYQYDAYFAFNSQDEDGIYRWVVRKNYDPNVAPVQLPTDAKGNKVSSGIYFARARSEGGVISTKLILLK